MGEKSFPKFLRVVLPPLTHLSGTNQILSGVTSIPVIENAFLQMISKYLDFQYEIMFPPDGEFGFQEEDGNWTGIIGMLSRNEADLAIAYLMHTEQRQQVVDFSMPYTVQAQVFVTSVPAEVPQMGTYIYPFDTIVWVLFTVLFIIMSFLFRVTDLGKRSMLDVITVVFGSVCKQPFQVKNTATPFRFIQIIWWIFVTFMALAYSSVLLSFLTIPLRTKGIQTTEELSIAVVSGAYKALVPMGSSILQQMMISDKKCVRKLGNIILKNDWYYDVRKDITNYFHESTILIGPKLRFSGALFERRQVSTDSFGIWNVGIAMRKNFCCKEILDHFVLRCNDAGLYHKIIMDQISRSGIVYFNELVDLVNSESLDMNDVYGIFLLFLAGITLSFVCFIVEISYHIAKNVVNSDDIGNISKNCAIPLCQHLKKFSYQREFITSKRKSIRINPL